jgi:hypothetical protein
MILEESIDLLQTYPKEIWSGIKKKTFDKERPAGGFFS